jgi:hypothetical protein
VGPEIYGVKWRNFKLALVLQKYSTDPVGKLPSPRIINLITDPQEREPLDLPYLHSWTATHFNRLLGEYQASIKREAPVPAGAPWTTAQPNRPERQAVTRKVGHRVQRESEATSSQSRAVCLLRPAVDQRGPSTGMARACHQLLHAPPGRRGQDIAGMAQVVKVDLWQVRPAGAGIVGLRFCRSAGAQ